MTTRPQNGFTLLEILIALVVLSIGLLGIAALHLESLRTGRTALVRTKAVALANDMSDRMRANRAAARLGQYMSIAADNGANNDCADDTAGGPTVTCLPAQMAQHDIWLWKRSVSDPQRGLPGPGVAIISSDGAAVPTYTITLAWQESGQNFSYDLAVQP